MAAAAMRSLSGPLSAAEILNWASQHLRAANIETARLDARMLLAFVLSLPSDSLIFFSDRIVGDADCQRFVDCLRQRLAGCPVSKIIGEKEFYGLRFHVDTAVLDPRPDSETLVQAALDNLAQRNTPARILDLGTGSGCLLLSILHQRADDIGIGVDRSTAALAVAQRNAQALSLHSQALFVAGNWHHCVAGPFDLVIANPPYIASADLPRLRGEVMRWDPSLALDGGEDGLDCYRQILPGLARSAHNDTVLLLECGQDQADHVAGLGRDHGWSIVRKYADLGSIERVVELSLAKSNR